MEDVVGKRMNVSLYGVDWLRSAVRCFLLPSLLILPPTGVAPYIRLA